MLRLLKLGIKQHQELSCNKSNSARMLELVDNVDLKSIAVRRTGSSPVAGTKRTPLAQLVRAERS